MSFQSNSFFRPTPFNSKALFQSGAVYVPPGSPEGEKGPIAVFHALPRH